MRVRAAAGLYGADLARTLEIADVEDAQPAEALGADVLTDALQAAVQPAAGFLDGHDQEVADEGHVALSARTNDRTHQLRHAVRVQPVDVEAVVVAGDQHVAGEGHVGVGKAQ